MSEINLKGVLVPEVIAKLIKLPGYKKFINDVKKSFDTVTGEGLSDTGDMLRTLGATALKSLPTADKRKILEENSDLHLDDPVKSTEKDMRGIYPYTQNLGEILGIDEKLKTITKYNSLLVFKDTDYIPITEFLQKAKDEEVYLTKETGVYIKDYKDGDNIRVTSDLNRASLQYPKGPEKIEYFTVKNVLDTLYAHIGTLQENGVDTSFITNLREFFNNNLKGWEKVKPKQHLSYKDAYKLGRIEGFDKTLSYLIERIENNPYKNINPARNLALDEEYGRSRNDLLQTMQIIKKMNAGIAGLADDGYHIEKSHINNLLGYLRNNPDPNPESLMSHFGGVGDPKSVTAFYERMQIELQKGIQAAI